MLGSQIKINSRPTVNRLRGLENARSERSQCLIWESLVKKSVENQCNSGFFAIDLCPVDISKEKQKSRNN